MANSLQDISDVYGSIENKLELNVTYGSHHAKTGSTLTQSQTSSAPTVNVSGADSSSFYTLVMADPDAPSRENPKMREWRHWVITNIPGGSVAQGETIETYNGPTPPMGTHRYVFLLYQQKGKIQVDKSSFGANRGKWDHKAFASSNNLGSPVSATFFYCPAQK